MTTMTNTLKTILASVVIASGVTFAKQTVNLRATATYTPVAYHIDKESPVKPDQFQHCESAATFTLNASSPTLSLDYGAEVAGFPYVEISSFTGEYAQIELKYSEPYEGLGLPYGDGPWYVSFYLRSSIANSDAVMMTAVRQWSYEFFSNRNIQHHQPGSGRVFLLARWSTMAIDQASHRLVNHPNRSWLPSICRHQTNRPAHWRFLGIGFEPWSGLGSWCPRGPGSLR
jgi:hypothetical protein